MKLNLLLVLFSIAFLSGCKKDIPEENNYSNTDSKEPNGIGNSNSNNGCIVSSETIDGIQIENSQIYYDSGTDEYYVNALTDISEIILILKSNNTDISGVYNTSNSNSIETDECYIGYFTNSNSYESEANYKVYITSNDNGGYLIEFCDVWMQEDGIGSKLLEANFESYQ